MFDIVKLKNREIRQENGEQFGNLAENRFMRLTISGKWYFSIVKLEILHLNKKLIENLGLIIQPMR